MKNTVRVSIPKINKKYGFLANKSALFVLSTGGRARLVALNVTLVREYLKYVELIT